MKQPLSADKLRKAQRKNQNRNVANEMSYPSYVSNGYMNTYFPQQLPNAQMYNQPMQMGQQAALSNDTQIRYVNSEQEARNAQIPANGLPYFFLNRNTGEIYSKNSYAQKWISFSRWRA